jgi:putative NADPH-quinone reductase
MNISVILAHPDSGSFNHAIARTAVTRLKANGHEVFFHDLYAEGFDPLLPASEIPADAVLPAAVRDHCREIRRAEESSSCIPTGGASPRPSLQAGSTG